MNGTVYMQVRLVTNIVPLLTRGGVKRIYNFKAFAQCTVGVGFRVCLVDVGYQRGCFLVSVSIFCSSCCTPSCAERCY